MVLTGSKRAFEIMCNYWRNMGASITETTHVMNGQTVIFTTVDYQAQSASCHSFIATFIQEYNRQRHQWFVREYSVNDRIIEG